MYYINATPSENGNYGNPQSGPREDALALPDELLSDYIAARGFVLPTVLEGTVTALETNQAALDAYLEDHPDTPEPEPEADPQADTDAMLVDHELRISMLEIGLEVE